MNNTFDIQERIKSVHLTKTESIVAQYFAKNSSLLPFKSAKDIAFELGISDTSIIRTCRSLGLKGYTELQEKQAESLQAYVESSKYSIPLEQIADKYEKYKESSVDQILEMAMHNLKIVSAGNNAVQYKRAAELIYTSDHVFVAGFRGMAASAQSCGVMLRQYIPHIHISSVADSSCIEDMLDYGENDCIILFGVERYSKMSCALAEMALENKAKLIAITDKITAPIAYKADVVFLSEFSSPMPMNSFIATQFIIESIIFEISKIKGMAQEERLKRLNKNLTKTELY